MSSNWARLGGLGVRGYYQGRNMREDLEEREEEQEWRRGRRERQIGEEEYYDPIRREEAELGLKRGRREESYGEYSDPYRRRGLQRAEGREERQDSYDEYADPYRRRGLQRAEGREQREDSYNEYADPYRRRGLQRAEGADIRAQAFEEYADPYRRDALERQDTMGRYATEEAGRQNTYGAEAQQDFFEYRDGAEKMTQARAALANFSSTGDPIALQDYYNDHILDGISVEITKTEDGQYHAKYSNGKESTASKDELLKGSEEFFMNQPEILAMSNPGIGGPMAGGYGMGAYGGGKGGYGGRGGAASPYGNSAYVNEVRMRTDDLVRSGMSPIEARMKAHTMAGQKSSTPPQEAAAKFHADMLSELMPDKSQYMPAEEREMQVDRAYEMADKLTQRFMSQYYQEGYNGRSGGQPGIQTPGGGGAGQQQQFEVPENHAQMLRSDPSPEMRKYFDEVYGPGASEAVLNGE